MKQSKYLEIISEGGANYLIFIPTGEPIMKWVYNNKASVTQNMRLAEMILEDYDTYIRSVLKR